MITESKFMGGAAVQTLNGSTKTINPAIGRVHRIDIGSGIAAIKFPDATKLRLGAPILVIINATGQPVDMQYNGGTLFGVLATGYAAILGLVSNSSVDGSWSYQTRAWSSS